MTWPRGYPELNCLTVGFVWGYIGILKSTFWSIWLADQYSTYHWYQVVLAAALWCNHGRLGRGSQSWTGSDHPSLSTVVAVIVCWSTYSSRQSPTLKHVCGWTSLWDLKFCLRVGQRNEVLRDKSFQAKWSLGQRIMFRWNSSFESLWLGPAQGVFVCKFSNYRLLS